jgi:hypothetical protein
LASYRLISRESEWLRVPLENRMKRAKECPSDAHGRDGRLRAGRRQRASAKPQASARGPFVNGFPGDAGEGLVDCVIAVRALSAASADASGDGH